MAHTPRRFSQVNTERAHVLGKSCLLGDGLVNKCAATMLFLVKGSLMSSSVNDRIRSRRDSISLPASTSGIMSMPSSVHSRRWR